MLTHFFKKYQNYLGNTTGLGLKPVQGVNMHFVAAQTFIGVSKSQFKNAVKTIESMSSLDPDKLKRKNL